MKIWKSILVLIILVLLAGASFWGYQNYFATKKVNSLELISQDAIFVFETYEGATTWNYLVESAAYPYLEQFPAFDRIAKQLITLDSLTGSQGLIARELTDAQTTISMHGIGKETFDLLFMVNLREGKARNLLSEIEKNVTPGQKFQSRSYSGKEILEFFDESSDRKWSIAFLGDLALVSASSFLIEEAIRYYVNSELVNYNAWFSSTPYDTESKGRLLTSAKGLANLLKGVNGRTEGPKIAKFEQSQVKLSLDLFLEEDRLVFSGPLLMPDIINFTPSIQANLNLILDAIPNRTLAVTQFNLESIYETQKVKNRAFAPRETLKGQIQRELIGKGFLDNLFGELYLLDLEGFRGATGNTALLIRTQNSSDAFSILKGYLNKDSELVSDFYLDKEILLIDEDEFPAHVFEGKFQGFRQTFAVALENVLLLTNSQQAMKLALDDITSGNTWGNESRAPEASEELTANAGYSTVFLTTQVWDSWVENATPSWSSFLQKYASSFFNFPAISLRINQYSGQQIATVSFPFAPAEVVETAKTEAISLAPSKTYTLENRLTYGPKALVNHQDNTEDLVVQDDSNRLFLINSGGEEVFKKSLSGPIVSEIFQIDYYKNGKLQLLFATADYIYGIDRLGNALPSYPIQVPNQRIANLSLVDYSNTKEYRYFVSTESGDLYLLDKTGERLEGWNPLPIGEATLGAPSHHRIRGKGDFMVAFSEKGNLHLFNRRGEEKGNNPLPLGDSFNSPIFVFDDPNSNSMDLVNISKNGEIIKVNFNGEIIYRNQLIKEDRESEFFLVPDQGGIDFLFVSRQFNEIVFRNSSEEELFSVNSSSDSFIFQYFDFGAARKLIAVTDKVQEFTYLYGLEGNLLTVLPLESSGPLQITYDQKQREFLIRNVSGTRITEYRLAD